MSMLREQRRNYEKYRSNIIYDINDQFQDQFAEYRGRLLKGEAKYTLGDDVEEYCRRQLTRAALEIVERKQSPLDIDLVRNVLSSGFLNWSDDDAEFFRKCGEWKDIQLIADMSERPSYGFSMMTGPNSPRRYRLAAKAIYELGKTRLPELFALGLGDNLVLRIICLASDRTFVKLDFSDLTMLLYSKNDSVRRACALKLLKSTRKQDLSETLSSYLSGDQACYYNVVHWLDFGISAPRSLVVAAASRWLANMI